VILLTGLTAAAPKYFQESGAGRERRPTSSRATGDKAVGTASKTATEMRTAGGDKHSVGQASCRCDEIG